MLKHVHQLFAHTHQRRGSARRQVKPAEQLLPARFGGGVDFCGGVVGRSGLPGGDRLFHARMFGSKPLAQRFKECDARTDGQLGVTPQNLPRQSNARRLAAAGQQILTQFHQAFGTGRRIATPVTGEQRAAALGNCLQQFAEKRGVHLGMIAGPMTRSGNHVAMPGAIHNITTPRIISPTKGSTPHITSRSGISGAILLMTKILRPTGGWIRPISMTMVMITPNQMRSKFAARSGGRMIGAVIRMMETGGRKNPSTTTISRMVVSRIQRERCSDTIHSAVDWLMCR